MKMKSWNIKIFLTWIVVILLGVLLAYELYIVYNRSTPRPLSNADIPQSTIDWFKGLIDGGSDIGGILGPDNREPEEWSKYEDIDSMLRIEDEFFVIYYSKKDSIVERNKAMVCQRYAHEAIPMGELFMKSYPHPDSLNGRKLPIYLAKTVKDFRSICNQLGHGDPGTSAVGLYCFQYSVNGVYTDGIIISPEAWMVSDNQIDERIGDDFFKTTLWHEMNHFMYFTNWNYTQTSIPNLWFTEGLAEYFSGNYDRLRQVGDYNKLNLTDDFRGGGLTEYWAGFSAYLCLEKYFGKSRVSDMVAFSYNNSIDESVRMAIPNYSLELWDEQWHSYMEKKEYERK